jgi:hypothetical protein
VSDQQSRLAAVRDPKIDELPRPALHSPRCLCGCALATYATTHPATYPTTEPAARELRERAA